MDLGLYCMVAISEAESLGLFSTEADQMSGTTIDCRCCHAELRKLLIQVSCKLTDVTAD